MMMGFGLFGLFFMLLFWGALIAGGIWLVRALFPGSDGGPVLPGSRAQNALQILDERYARGEITREQYEQMKRDLGS